MHGIPGVLHYTNRSNLVKEMICLVYSSTKNQKNSLKRLFFYLFVCLFVCLFVKCRVSSLHLWQMNHVSPTNCYSKLFTLFQNGPSVDCEFDVYLCLIDCYSPLIPGISLQSLLRIDIFLYLVTTVASYHMITYKACNHQCLLHKALTQHIRVNNASVTRSSSQLRTRLSYKSCKSGLGTGLKTNWAS